MFLFFYISKPLAYLFYCNHCIFSMLLKAGISDISFRSFSENATVISLRMQHVRKKCEFLANVPLLSRHQESTLVTPLATILPSVPSSTISMSRIIFDKIPTVARSFFLPYFCRVSYYRAPFLPYFHYVTDNEEYFILAVNLPVSGETSATSFVIGNDNANDDNNGSTVQIISSK